MEKSYTVNQFIRANRRNFLFCCFFTLLLLILVLLRVAFIFYNVFAGPFDIDLSLILNGDNKIAETPSSDISTLLGPLERFGFTAEMLANPSELAPSDMAQHHNSVTYGWHEYFRISPDGYSLDAPAIHVDGYLTEFKQELAAVSYPERYIKLFIGDYQVYARVPSDMPVSAGMELHGNFIPINPQLLSWPAENLLIYEFDTTFDTVEADGIYINFSGLLFIIVVFMFVRYIRIGKTRRHPTYKQLIALSGDADEVIERIDGELADLDNIDITGKTITTSHFIITRRLLKTKIASRPQKYDSHR